MAVLDGELRERPRTFLESSHGEEQAAMSKHGVGDACYFL